MVRLRVDGWRSGVYCAANRGAGTVMIPSLTEQND